MMTKQLRRIRFTMKEQFTNGPTVFGLAMTFLSYKYIVSSFLSVANGLGRHAEKMISVESSY
jgi:hypothetical protein